MQKYTKKQNLPNLKIIGYIALTKRGCALIEGGKVAIFETAKAAKIALYKALDKIKAAASRKGMVTLLAQVAADLALEKAKKGLKKFGFNFVSMAKVWRAQLQVIKANLCRI